MRNRFLAFIMPLAAAAVIAVPQLRGEQGKLDDIVVKEKDTVTLEREKTPFTVTLDYLKVIRPSPEDNRGYLDKRASGLKEPRPARPGSIMTDITVSPWLNTIARGTVASLPLKWEKGRAASWEFIITDRTGSPFRVFAGKGLPPKNIEWDGRDGKGGFMNVGSTYSSILKVVDRTNGTFTYVGDSFSVSAAEHQEKDGLMLDLVLDTVFAGGADPLAISDSGQRVLDECADVLKEKYPAGFVITVFSETDQRALRKADSMARFLARKLIIPADSFYIDGKKGVSGNYTARVTILNRGDKAVRSLGKATLPGSEADAVDPAGQSLPR